jgi:elongation factor P--(R)-beta-lysine ligase
MSEFTNPKVIIPESINPETNTRALLQKRAECFHKIRQFFKQKDVIEVDTRLLDDFSVTDPYMNALSVIHSASQSQYLQTSPEFAMKRLLAKGSGDIYQLGKAFRAEEKGQYHDNEFTLLEWYRIGFSLNQLMDEVFDLMTTVVGDKNKTMLTYQQAFNQALNIDPFTISLNELESIAREKLGDIPQDLLFDNYLTLLFSEVIEPTFSQGDLTFIYHYPQSQASLAKTTQQNNITVAERFEVYCGSFELANGFNELTDADEQLARFKQDNTIRQSLNYPEVEIDNRLIEALKNGLPQCSGVAVGVDRLLMLHLAVEQIDDVLPLSR